jgi:hypothetical protein
MFTSNYYKLALLTVLLLFWPGFSHALTDSDKFAEGKIAFDKYDDCPAALDAFLAVSAEGRQNPLWNYYIAQTYECLAKYDIAIKYYEAYNELVPGRPAITEKLADLRYNMNRQKVEDEARKAAMEKAAVDKDAVEARRNNLSGFWIGNNGVRYKFNQDDTNEVYGYNTIKNNLMLSGKIISGHLKGQIFDGKWRNRVIVNGEEKCPGAFYPNADFDFKISDDGNSLEGYYATYKITFDTCKIEENILGGHLVLTRDYLK